MNQKNGFEFLDNDVPLGELPRTAAFGWNGTMTILDVNLMLNIDRYRQVDIRAKQADQVLNLPDPASVSHLQFIQQCAKKVKCLDFADQETLDIYASVRDGKLIWWDKDYIVRNVADKSLQLTWEALGYTGERCSARQGSDAKFVDQSREHQFLVGRLGS